MNIIIVGGGEFGYQLAKELHESHELTLIDVDEKSFDRFGRFDIRLVPGNGASAQILSTANIEKADVIIACTSSDEINMISCGTAKKLSKIDTICFVNHHEYIETFKSENNKLLTHEHFGLDQVIWPKKALADEIEKIISVPAAIDVEVFAKGQIKLFEYRVKENTAIKEKQLKDCKFPEGCIIVAITRDEELFIPDGNTTLEVKDKVIFIGTDEALKLLSIDFFEKEQDIKKVTIIGGGTVGTMVAQNITHRGINVILIENHEEAYKKFSSQEQEYTIIHGDGTDLELLQSHQIGQSDVLVSVTNNDEKNLLCSLLGKQLGVRKVITRVDKSYNIKLFDLVGIDVALSPKSSAVKELMNSLVESHLDILAIVEMGKGKVLEIQVSEDFEDNQLKELTLPENTIIGAIIRRKKVTIPKGNSLIRPGDKLIVFTTQDSSRQVKHFFETVNTEED